MSRRNPLPPQRHTVANEQRTYRRVEEYQVLSALLATWEGQSADTQVREHEYIVHLKQRVRAVRNYLLHRADETI